MKNILHVDLMRELHKKYKIFKFHFLRTKAGFLWIFFFNSLRISLMKVADTKNLSNFAIPQILYDEINQNINFAKF